MNSESRAVKIDTGKESVSGIFKAPPEPAFIYVFAHGAGAGMTHPFMERMSAALMEYNIGTLRYQFPYMEKRSKRPDASPALIRTVEAACRFASALMPMVPLFAGGKSMGGRMTSHASADGRIDFVKGLVFLGFPLHPPGKPSIERADHLARTSHPMLFLQGTRDKLADLSLLTPICKELGSRVILHVMDGADHSFGYLKDQRPEDVYRLLATVIAEWSRRFI